MTHDLYQSPLLYLINSESLACSLTIHLQTKILENIASIVKASKENIAALCDNLL